MKLTRSQRKLTLTTHIIFSIGWVGAVACFLILGAIGMRGKDIQSLASYLSMEQIIWLIILPMSLASPLTGLLLSLGTRWGLFRHYWISIKFLITVFSVAVLLVHLQPINAIADFAGQLVPGQQTSIKSIGSLQLQLVVAPAAALVAFLVNAALAVYKPKGMTRYGQRKLYKQILNPNV